MVLHWGLNYLAGDIWQFLETYLIVTMREGAPNISWAEVRDAAERSAMQRTAIYAKNWLAENVDSEEAAKPLSKWLYLV